jgi:serine/threonine protein kinase
MSDVAGTRVMRTLVPGTRLGRYVLVERIGQGGMAEVFLARAEGMRGFEKIVALKVIREQLVDDAHHIALLLDEARLAATLDHPGIVQVFDVGAHGDEHYLTMEYIHGRDLRQLLKAAHGRGGMPLPLAVLVVHEVALALHYAHTRTSPDGRPLGIVHRDVSPSNIMVSFEGAVKLTDFGIAKITANTTQTRTGTFKGKFGYMSPEQCLQQDVDARSDVFSLGIVLYELTTSRRAFAGDNPFVTLNRTVEARYDPPESIVPDYPAELSRIVACALSADRDDRHPDAKALADTLDAFARDLGGMPTRLELKEWIGALMGWPAPPDITRIDAILEATRHEAPVTEPTPRTRALPRWAAVGSAVAVAGILGWRVGQSAPPDDDAAPSPAPVVATPPDPAPQLPAPAADPAPPAAPPPTIVAREPAPPPIATSEKPKKSTPRKSTPRITKQADDGSRIESLLPPSAKPSR